MVPVEYVLRDPVTVDPFWARSAAAARHEERQSGGRWTLAWSPTRRGRRRQQGARGHAERDRRLAQLCWCRNGAGSVACSLVWQPSGRSYGPVHLAVHEVGDGDVGGDVVVAEERLDGTDGGVVLEQVRGAGVTAVWLVPRSWRAPSVARLWDRLSHRSRLQPVAAGGAAVGPSCGGNGVGRRALLIAAPRDARPTATRARRRQASPDNTGGRTEPSSRESNTASPAPQGSGAEAGCGCGLTETRGRRGRPPARRRGIVAAATDRRAWRAGPGTAPTGGER